MGVLQAWLDEKEETVDWEPFIILARSISNAIMLVIAANGIAD